MQQAFLRVYGLYARFVLGLAMVGGASTFLIMCVICLNAFTRKTMNAPVPAALEVTQSLLVVAIMIPFAFTQLKREHVSTTVLVERLGPGARRGLALAWLVIGCVLFALITAGAFEFAMRSYRMNEQIWGATIQFPLWPAKMSVCAATGLLSVQFLLDAIGTILVPNFRAAASAQGEIKAHV